MSLVMTTSRRPDYHEQFAAVYDTFYRRRDVGGEVSLGIELLGLSRRDGDRPRVLDFGCGTGSHVLEFARRDVAATGFDISEAMVAEAQHKTRSAPEVDAAFAHGDFDAFCASEGLHRFDGAVSYFNVLNCMTSADAMLRHLERLRGLLVPGGRLMIDVWNGAAVYADEPRPDVRHFRDDHDANVERIRITIPTVDRIEQRCTLQYRVLTLNRGDGRFCEFESVHRLHFLTPAQYRHLFSLSGLTLMDEFPKGRPGTPISDRDWYITYLVASAA